MATSMQKTRKKEEEYLRKGSEVNVSGPSAQSTERGLDNVNVVSSTRRMGPVTSFQAFARIASFITGSVFSAFSILLRERLFNSKNT